MPTRTCSRLPATGLRFFTVYGPWGRPDMAMWLFAEAILAGPADPAVQPRPHAPRLHLYRRRHRGGGPARPQAARRQTRNGRATRPIRPTSAAPWRVYNIGNSKPVEVTEVVRLIEQALGQNRNSRNAADAAGRRAGDLRRRRRPRARGRLPAENADRGRRSSVHRLVSRLPCT